MTKRERHENSGISIIDAVEMLSDIADFDFEQDLEEISIQVPEKRKVAWLRAGSEEGVIGVIRETLHTILNHFRHLYKSGSIPDPKNIEGMKTVMVLVGEAAKKLDHYTNLFRETKIKSVTELKEYKDLQEFYLKKVAKKIDEGVLGRWIWGLAQRAFEKKKAPRLRERVEVETKHVFVDLESVKNDSEYELFFMRKEDGSRFFSPRLLRNVKLVCDFGDFLGEQKFERNSFMGIPNWQDRVAHADAKTILQATSSLINQFYHEAMHHRDKDIVSALNKCIMALILCADPHHLINEHPAKACRLYFADFQLYLREALFTHDYHKMLAYPPRKEQVFSKLILTLCQKLCEAFFTQLKGYQDISGIIQGLLIEAHDHMTDEQIEAAKSNHTIWNQLSFDYVSMTKLLKSHPQGPLVKVIECLEEGGYQKFDPLIQHNIPSHLYELDFEDRKVSINRIPSPTSQEFIHKAKVVDEFKEYLRFFGSRSGHQHLVIDLQDNTSWRDHARSKALEDLQKQDEFSDVLTVVTLSTDSDFYHQIGAYHDLNHADIFMEHFKEHLEGEGYGFYLPLEVKRQLFPVFVDGLMESVHRIFFSGRNVLRREDRQDFIEIFYLFLTLKLIEVVQPDSISFTCKDGVDTGEMYSTLLFGLMKLIHDEKISQADIDFMTLMIYAPAILIRERIPLSDRFNRMISVLKEIELVRHDLGFNQFNKSVNDGIGIYYKIPIFQAGIVVPKGD